MAKASRLGAVTSTLSFRLFLILSLSILLLFAIYTTLAQRVQTAAIETQVKSNAYRASDVIRRSLYTAMLRNERSGIHELIRLYGAEPGIEVIRIYNKQGQIAFSTVEREIGTSVDRQTEACYVCHAAARPLSAVPTAERARIYRKADGHRVLGLINPIPNDPGCAQGACHAHSASASMLGVLDVQMSLVALDVEAAAARNRALALAAGVVLLSMLLMALIVYRAVYKPTHLLRLGTRRLAAGDLSVEIDLHRSDELGLLADSFNHMARSLRAADAELREWSRTLEVRVQQKADELERLNAGMVQVEKAASLGHMALTVAHELNNPLSGILTNAKLTARRINAQVPEGPDKERLLHALELISSEAMRCGNIVRDLLTYARRGNAAFRPSSLNHAAGRALELVAHHTVMRGVTTETDLVLADDLVVCDPDQIVQALVALLINAVESMGEGGRLTVRTASDLLAPDHVLLSVSDTGVGIPPDVVPHIFDPFFSTKGETKGVGLGLAVVYGIVKRHHGRIDVDSRPGQGTTFTITLPRQIPGHPIAETAGAGAAAGVGEGTRHP
ncbi:MAG: sensor histidine kinase [Gemmatimonadales bacterium]